MNDEDRYANDPRQPARRRERQQHRSSGSGLGALDRTPRRGFDDRYGGHDRSGRQGPTRRDEPTSRASGADWDERGDGYGPYAGLGREEGRDIPGMYGQGGYGDDDMFYGSRFQGRDARGNEGYASYGRRRGEPDVTGYRGERGYLERAGDEIASWFGDDDASHRRRQDAREGDEGAQHHGGRGPRNYQRSDERIRDDVNDRLTEDWGVDARDVEVSVADREVTLSGSVATRYEKRRAEDITDSVSGVTHVQNNLRVKPAGAVPPVDTTA